MKSMVNILSCVLVVCAGAVVQDNAPTIRGHRLGESVADFYRIQGINIAACGDKKEMKRAKVYT